MRTNNSSTLRRYDQWPGNLKGIPEDTARCVQEVRSPGAWPHYHQCSRKRGFGMNGLYCRQHAKRHEGSERE